jgi:hypothetical protein
MSDMPAVLDIAKAREENRERQANQLQMERLVKAGNLPPDYMPEGARPEPKEVTARRARAAALHIFSLEAERLAAFPPRTWRGFYTPGLNLVLARKGIGKSYFVQASAYATAAGEPFLGRSSEVSRTLIIYTEIDRQAGHERALRYGPAPKGLDVAYGWSRGPEALLDVEAAVLIFDYRVVIIDMFQGVLPYDLESNNYDAGHLFLEWRQLAQRLGFCLVTTWHAVKAERDDYVSMSMGTTALPAQSDVILFLDRKRTEAKGKLSIAGNHGREEVLMVRFEDCIWTLEGDGAPAPKLSETERAILDTLSSTPEGLSAANIAGTIGKTSDSVRSLLSRLGLRTLVVKRDGRWYGVDRDKTKQSEFFSTDSPGHSENGPSETRQPLKGASRSLGLAEPRDGACSEEDALY